MKALRITFYLVMYLGAMFGTSFVGTVLTGLLFGFGSLEHEREVITWTLVDWLALVSLCDAFWHFRDKCWQISGNLCDRWK